MHVVVPVSEADDVVQEKVGLEHEVYSARLAVASSLERMDSVHLADPTSFHFAVAGAPKQVGSQPGVCPALYVVAPTLKLVGLVRERDVALHAAAPVQR